MRCGKPDHQPGQKCPAKNAKCKDCYKIEHFHKVCQTKKRARQFANLVQAPTQDDDDTHIDENGIRQPNPARVSIFKLVDYIEATRGMPGKHLKFPIAKHPKGPYKHKIVVRVDTGADVNYMNEKTFNELFPEGQLSVCPHEIQNFGNSVADISILGQFRAYLEFWGEKYLSTFTVTNVNDCPNLLSYGATFRMGVLLPKYPEENVVIGDRAHFSRMNRGKTGNGTPHSTASGTSNVFQILNDIWKRQRAVQCQYNSCTMAIALEMPTSFRTNTPSTSAMQHVQYQYNSSTMHNVDNSSTTTSTVTSMVPTTRISNFFQDHHTLCTSCSIYDNKTG